jgi:hypothetical protein
VAVPSGGASGFRAVSGMGSHGLLGGSSLHAPAPMLTASTPVHYGQHTAISASHPWTGFGKSNLRSGGTNATTRGLGNRALVGGFTVPLSNPLSKPKVGFAVE